MNCNVGCGCSYIIGLFKSFKKKPAPPPEPPKPVQPVTPTPAPTPARQPDRIEWVTKRYNVPCAEVTYEVKKVNGVETGEMRNTKNISSDTYTTESITRRSGRTETVTTTTFKRWYVNGTQVCVEKVSETSTIRRIDRDSERDHTADDPNKSNNS